MPFSAKHRETDAHAANEAVRQELAELRARNESSLDPAERQHWVLWAALRQVLPADAVVMADATQLVYTGCFAFPADQPGCWHYPSGYCTLGAALPMAIGAKLAAPERPVVAAAGDGGFMFTLQELATAVEQRLSLPIVLWNNDGLRQIRDDMDAREIPRIGVEPRNPDFAALARSFGCAAARPDSLKAFKTAVAQAQKTPVPTLIEVRQDADWLG